MVDPAPNRVTIVEKAEVHDHYRIRLVLRYSSQGYLVPFDPPKGLPWIPGGVNPLDIPCYETKDYNSSIIPDTYME